MNIIRYPERAEWNNVLKRSALHTEDIRPAVQEIIGKVRTEGDRALYEYEEKFDKVKLASLIVTPEEFDEAGKALESGLKEAILRALENIRAFHAAQKFESKKVETVPGVTCWQKAVPIEKVGLYIPGGTAPLSLPS